MNAIIQAWAGVAIGSFAVGVALRWVRLLFNKANNGAIRWADRTVEEAKSRRDLVVSTYVETGRHASAIDSLPRRFAKAARVERAARVEERAEQSGTFRAYCNCPDCNDFDVHWLKPGGRICKRCEYEWSQE